MQMTDDDLIADLRGLQDSDSISLIELTLSDAAFVAARRDTPPPSDILIARVMRDARTAARTRRRHDLMAWGSLVAACVIGVAFGVGDPGGYLDAALWGGAVSDLAGGYGFQYAEVRP